jgi:hypothetical protein
MLTILVIALLAAAITGTARAAHSHRYQVAQQLAQGLQGTPLAGYAFQLEAEGRRWNVNPYMVAAISGVESSFGSAACGGNAWGLGSCSVSIASFADGIRYVTRQLRTGYLNRGMSDVWSIGRIYCPPCGSGWGDKVAWFMHARFGLPAASQPTVTYP